MRDFGLNDCEPDLGADALYHVEGVGYMDGATLARYYQMYLADPNLTGLGELGGMLKKFFKKAGKNIKTIAHNIGEAAKAAIKKPTLGNIFKAVAAPVAIIATGGAATGVALAAISGTKKGQETLKEAAVITAKYGPTAAVAVLGTVATIVSAGALAPAAALATTSMAAAIKTTETIIQTKQAATAQKDAANEAKKEAATLTAQAAALDKQTAALQTVALPGAPTSKTWLYVGLGAAVLVAVGAFAAARRKD